jgi:hypothetical protein
MLLRVTSARRTLAAVLLLAAFGACGGDGDNEETAPTTTLGATSTTTASSFTGAGSEPFCNQARQAQQELAGLTQAGSSPEAMRDVFLAAAAALRSLAEAAPPEIKGDVETIAASYDDLQKSLEAAGWDPTKLPGEITGRLTAPDITAASQRLNAYQQQVCGAPTP